MAFLESTEGEEHTDRLRRLETPLWRRVPDRWNLQRHVTRTRRQSFPLLRAAGTAFTHNEFVLTADRASGA